MIRYRLPPSRPMQVSVKRRKLTVEERRHRRSISNTLSADGEGWGYDDQSESDSGEVGVTQDRSHGDAAESSAVAGVALYTTESAVDRDEMHDEAAI